jgi:hypothetical protein
MRMTRRSGDVTTLGTLLTFPADFFSTITAIVTLLLSFPARLAPGDSAASVAAGALYVLAALAIAGAIVGVVRVRPRTDAHPSHLPHPTPPPHRWFWVVMSLTCIVYLVAAAVYSGGLTWYYLLAFVPMGALFVARAVDAGSPAVRIAAVAVAIACAVAQAVFVYRFDAAATATGMLRIDSSRVMIRRAPGEAFSLTMREVREISESASRVVPDGATALQAVHGMRGEFWRESGAEFMPWAAAPEPNRPTHFTVAGRNAAPLRDDTRMLGAGVCAAPRDEIRWRAQHRALPGWEAAAFGDESWYAVAMPRRTEGPSLAADDPRFVEWRSGRVVLRGRFTVADITAGRKRFIAITAHSPPGSAVPLTELFVNGVATAPTRTRVMYGIYLNQEWLVDLTDLVRPGENLIAIGFASARNTFDLDVFEVPCTDSEFYF